MFKKLVLGLAALLLAANADAAITLVTSQAWSGSGSTVGGAMPSAGSVGDLYECWAYDESVSTNITPTISSTVNTGTWNTIAASVIYQNNIKTLEFWIKATASGTPTITLAGLNGDYWQFSCLDWTGFATGNPNPVAADITTNYGTSGTVSFTGLTTTATTELVVARAAFGGGQNAGTRTGSFTDVPFRYNDTGAWSGSVVETSAGQALTQSFAITSASFINLIVGFQDGSPAPSAGGSMFFASIH